VSGDVVEGVLVTLSPGGLNDTTDGSGNYEISAVPNGAYTVTPTKEGYRFSPADSEAIVNDGSVTGKDFTSTANVVSGAVSGDVQEGVLVTLTGGLNDTTDGSGDYEITPVPNGTYTITPTKNGYTFSPETDTAVVNDADVTGKDFVASSAGSTFNNRREITIDHTKVPSTQTDIPVYVTVTGLDKTKVQTGEDFIFYAGDDTTRLPCEIEDYDDSGATGVLTAWVKVPSVSGSVDTVIYMYYNCAGYSQPAADSTYGSQAVWSDNFVMVQHMYDSPDASHVADSTSNDNDGTKYDTGTQIAESTTAKTRTAEHFLNRLKSQYIDFGNDSSLNPGEITINLWFRHSYYTYELLSRNDENGWMIKLNSSSKHMEFKGKDSSDGTIYFNGDTNLWDSPNTFHFIGIVYGSGPTQGIFVNGSADSVTVTNAGNGTLKTGVSANLFAAKYSGVSSRVFGYLEEIWISSVKRSDDWLTVVYNNQNDPSTFYAVGAETNDTKVAS